MSGDVAISGTDTGARVAAPSPAEEVRHWLTERWDPALTLREWWRRLFDAGYAFPSWPVGLGGRGLSPDDARVVTRELAAARVVGPPAGVGQSLGGPTLMMNGTPQQQATFVPALARGEDAWVQLFSEPGSGSDLASLSTRAVLDGDEWIVNGQKVWSSGAETANRGMLLARTDVDVPKHKGITYLILDLDQPGVEVRPLRQMDGEAHFCEVFFADARVPADRVIGSVDDGWRVAQTTLAFERSGTGGGDALGLRLVTPGAKAGNLDRTVAEILEQPGQTERAARGFFLPAETLFRIAEERGLSDDPVRRQQLATYYTHLEVMRLTGLRMQAASRQGRQPGPEASTMMLALGENAKRFRALVLELYGPYGMLAGGDAPDGESTHAAFYWSFAANIGGGTDEIQRNVIGERALGLPREPQVDRDVPYRDLKVGTQRA